METAVGPRAADLDLCVLQGWATVHSTLTIPPLGTTLIGVGVASYLLQMCVYVCDPLFLPRLSQERNKTNQEEEKAWRGWGVRGFGVLVQ